MFFYERKKNMTGFFLGRIHNLDYPEANTKRYINIIIKYNKLGQ